MYLIYDKETGIVDRALYGSSEPIDANIGPDEAFIAVRDPVIARLPDYSYIHNGEWVHAAPAPSPHHEWDWPTKSWLPNLDAAREAQRQAWNAWRDRELIAGYTHNGRVFHSDDTFIGELQLLLKGYERGVLTGTSAIRTRDNGTLQMTHAEVESLLLLIGLHRQVIYA